ncbi:MAG TPA: hypothetical protein VLC54_03280 [Anaeromyxobacter sp.]|nr:hypothetical protein [Anaeromyxobacter sp.]
MVRVERTSGALTLVSRLARPRVLVVLAGALVLCAAGLRGGAPRAALALVAAAALVVLLGGRSVRATFARGRVRVRPAVPLQGGGERALAEFVAVRQETIGEARARRAARLARGYTARSRSAAPTWLVPQPTAGANDHLRRLVLVARDRDGEPFSVTAWLAPDDDLEPARAEIEALLR